MSKILDRDTVVFLFASLPDDSEHPHVTEILAHDEALRLALATERESHDKTSAQRDEMGAELESCTAAMRAAGVEIDRLRLALAEAEKERDAALARAATMALMLDTIDGVATGQSGEIPDAVEQGWSTALPPVLALIARAESAERERDGLMAAFRWCDLRLEQALSAEELDEQPIPGDEMASSIKWRINRVRKKLRDLAAARESEQRWAKEYHHKWQSAEARLAEATRVMLALADERDPDVLTVMSTLLRAAGNTPQADLCALLAREVPR